MLYLLDGIIKLAATLVQSYFNGLMNHYKSGEGIHNNAESKKALKLYLYMYVAEIKFWVLVWLLISCLPVPDLGRIHTKLNSFIRIAAVLWY